MLKKYLEKYLVFREKEIFFKYLKITYDTVQYYFYDRYIVGGVESRGWFAE